jgi:hypothetical protein
VEPRGWTMTTARGRPACSRAPASSRSAESAGEHAPRRPRRRCPAGELARPRAPARNNFLLNLAAGEQMAMISMGVAQQAASVTRRGEVERRRGGGGAAGGPRCGGGSDWPVGRGVGLEGGTAAAGRKLTQDQECAVIRGGGSAAGTRAGTQRLR